MLKKYVTFLRRHNIITPKTLEDLKNACISDKTNSSNPLPPWMDPTYEQYTKDITKIIEQKNPTLMKEIRKGMDSGQSQAKIDIK